MLKPKALPATYHLTVVKDPEKQSGWWNVVLMKMEGDAVLKRSVIQPAEPNLDLALDALNRMATRVFYFGEAEEHL